VEHPEILTVDGEHCIATWHNVLIQIWRKETTSSAISNLDRLTRMFIARSRLPVCSIAVVEKTSPPPSDAVRSALAAFYKELAPQMSVAVVIAEGGGFRGAIVRGVGLTLSTFAPRALPFQFATTVNEGAKFVAPHLPAAARGAIGLEGTIDNLRTKIPADVAAQLSR
jgi:hypothetical protein